MLGVSDLPPPGPPPPLRPLHGCSGSLPTDTQSESWTQDVERMRRMSDLAGSHQPYRQVIPPPYVFSTCCVQRITTTHPGRSPNVCKGARNSQRVTWRDLQSPPVN